MKGDFSRLTFNPKRHYTSVRMQQGRVQLDADWNEQADILRHALTTQFIDLIGQSGTPSNAAGFEIKLEEEELAAEESRDADDSEKRPKKRFPAFEIGRGRYYVDGMLCENESSVLFTNQPDYPGASGAVELEDAERFFIYLDVWERHLTSIEAPSIREPALGGADTATRTQTIWQVKYFPIWEEDDDDFDDDEKENEEEVGEDDRDHDHEENRHRHDRDDETHRRENIWRAWEAFLAAEANTVRLRVRQSTAYTGQGNQLYRVEIQGSEGKHPVFKWSRENGSVAFPMTGFQPGADPTHWIVTLANLERDPLVLKAGDWVELANDESVLNGTPLPLCQVITVNAHQGQVVLEASGSLPKESIGNLDSHPLLRRWDQTQAANGELVDGAVPGAGEKWIPLEYGIEVNFSAGGRSRPGDYWQIPARSITGEIEWPYTEPAAPHGVSHHFAPLALLARGAEGWEVRHDLRHIFVPAPVMESEDLAIFKQLRSERSVLSKLEVVVADLMEELGDIRKDSSHGGSYLSLIYRSVEPLEEGDVVALNPEEKERVVPANRKNEGLVVGVVGKLLGETRGGEFKVRVVTYGKTVCKVMGKIRPGDLLSPAEAAACAVNAGHSPKLGTVIGKALEKHRSEDDDDEDNDDIGKIEIFVTIS